jgi:ATP-binding protein involved in chromosome partitioning
MSALTEASIYEALRSVEEPELHRDIVSLNMVKDVVISPDNDVSLKIELTTPACPLKDEIERNVGTTLASIGARSVEVSWGAMVRRAAPTQAKPELPGVKNVIAVASGKGGVGKTTVSANLAVALAMEGASVGLLDADITGPNIPLMLGVEGRPVASPDNKITPLERYGVKVMSIQFFVAEGQPVVWRGPLVGGAIQQFLRDVDWGELDYLVVDLPPGTSDAQLTLAQAVGPQLTGALLVTTPQDVALMDVQKALQMFRRLSVPIMGVVENMSAFVCPHCGEATEIFGRGGGERFARQYDLEYFGGIPLDVKVRQGSDAGVPAVAQREPGPAAEVMRSLARTLAARMSVRAATQTPVLSIS